MDKGMYGILLMALGCISIVTMLITALFWRPWGPLGIGGSLGLYIVGVIMALAGVRLSQSYIEDCERRWDAN